MAAGFSLTEDKIEEFKQFVGEYVQAKLGEEKLTPVVSIDAVISLSGANDNLADCLAQLEPFGASNPEPRLVIEDVKIIKSATIGSGHVKCVLTSDFSNGLKAIAFRCADTNMGMAMLNAKGERFNVAGTLRKDNWQGRSSLQFIIEDIMEA